MIDFMLIVLPDNTEKINTYDIRHIYIQHTCIYTFMGAGCEKVLPSSRKSTNTGKRKNGSKTPAFGSHPHNNRLKPKSSVDARIIINSDGNLEYICILTKCHPTRSSQRTFTKKGKRSYFTVGRSGQSHLNQMVETDTTRKEAE